MFLFFLFVASSSILSFRYSLILFLQCLLVSHLIPFRLSPYISRESCNHYNLAYFLPCNKFEHPSSNHGLCFFIHNNLIDSLWLKFLIFSLNISQALFISTSASEISKILNLFEISTRYWFLPSTSFKCLNSASPYELCALFVYSLPVSP
jgi:hypothetical protein